MNSKSTNNKNNKYIVFVGIGFELIGLIFSAIYFGEYLDKYFHSKGVVTIFLIGVMLIGWSYHLILLNKKINQDDEVK